MDSQISTMGLKWDGGGSSVGWGGGSAASPGRTLWREEEDCGLTPGPNSSSNHSLLQCSPHTPAILLVTLEHSKRGGFHAAYSSPEYE